MSFYSTSFRSKNQNPNSVRIGLIDPNIAQIWAHRVISDGTTISPIKKGDTINHTTSQPIATGLFCQRIFGPCIDYTCACGHEKIRIHVNANVSPPICPECRVEWTEASVRRQRLGSIELVSPVIHKWFSDTRNYIPILTGITVKSFKSLKECKLFFPFSLENTNPKIHYSIKTKQINSANFSINNTLENYQFSVKAQTQAPGKSYGQWEDTINFAPVIKAPTSKNSLSQGQRQSIVSPLKKKAISFKAVSSWQGSSPLILSLKPKGASQWPFGPTRGRWLVGLEGYKAKAMTLLAAPRPKTKGLAQRAKDQRSMASSMGQGPKGNGLDILGQANNLEGLPAGQELKAFGAKISLPKRDRSKRTSLGARSSIMTIGEDQKNNLILSSSFSKNYGFRIMKTLSVLTKTDNSIFFDLKSWSGLSKLKNQEPQGPAPIKNQKELAYIRSKVSNIKPILDRQLFIKNLTLSNFIKSNKTPKANSLLKKTNSLVAQGSNPLDYGFKTSYKPLTQKVMPKELRKSENFFLQKEKTKNAKTGKKRFHKNFYLSISTIGILKKKIKFSQNFNNSQEDEIFSYIPRIKIENNLNKFLKDSNSKTSLQVSKDWKQLSSSKISPISEKEKIKQRADLLKKNKGQLKDRKCNVYLLACGTPKGQNILLRPLVLTYGQDQRSKALRANSEGPRPSILATDERPKVSDQRSRPPVLANLEVNKQNLSMVKNIPENVKTQNDISRQFLNFTNLKLKKNLQYVLFLKLKKAPPKVLDWSKGIDSGDMDLETLWPKILAVPLGKLKAYVALTSLAKTEGLRTRRLGPDFQSSPSDRLKGQPDPTGLDVLSGPEGHRPAILATGERPKVSDQRSRPSILAKGVNKSKGQPAEGIQTTLLKDLFLPNIKKFKDFSFYKKTSKGFDNLLNFQSKFFNNNNCFPVRPSFTQPEDFRRQFIKFITNNGYIQSHDIAILRYIDKKNPDGSIKSLKPSGLGVYEKDGSNLKKNLNQFDGYAIDPLNQIHPYLSSPFISLKDFKKKYNIGVVDLKNMPLVASLGHAPESLSDEIFPKSNAFGLDLSLQGMVHRTKSQAKDQRSKAGSLDLRSRPLVLAKDLSPLDWPAGPETFGLTPLAKTAGLRSKGQPTEDVWTSRVKTLKYFDPETADPKSQDQTVKKILSQTGGGGLQEYLGHIKLEQLVLILQNDLFEIAPRLAKSQNTRRVLYRIMNETLSQLDQKTKIKDSLSKASNVVSSLSQGEKATSSISFLEENKNQNKENSLSDLKNLLSSKKEIESLEKKYKDLKKEYKTVKKICSDFQNRKNAHKRRYKLAFQLLRTMSNPAGMTLSSIPVLPPGLRPIIDVPKIGPITADLNIRYRGLIFALRNLRELAYVDYRNAGAAQASVQEAVDDLLYTGGKTRRDKGINSSPNLYKSLAMRLKGKHGRFRGNLLGKRVDYSGRSVIVVGPALKIHQCGLPFEIAIKLFNPFLIRRLIQKGLCKNVYKAKQVLLDGKFKPIIWTLCREVMLEHLVLLNRAPTLHRLGVQAFMPILISGRAILLHPLVCTGFNADFDGDQMGVHVPLFPQARAEAWKMMWSRNNFLSPSSGEPILLPSQDMVLGCYYLTESPLLLKANKKDYSLKQKIQPFWSCLDTLGLSQRALAPQAFGLLAFRPKTKGLAQKAMAWTNIEGPKVLVDPKSQQLKELDQSLLDQGRRPKIIGLSPTRLDSFKIRPPVYRLISHGRLAHKSELMNWSYQNMLICNQKNGNIHGFGTSFQFKKSSLKTKISLFPSLTSCLVNLQDQEKQKASNNVKSQNTKVSNIKTVLDNYRRGLLNIQSIVWIKLFTKTKIVQNQKTGQNKHFLRPDKVKMETVKMESDNSLTVALELRITPYGTAQLLQTSAIKKSLFSGSLLLPVKGKLNSTFNIVSIRTTIGRLLFNDVLQNLEFLV